ncbi:glycosyltransferase family protein [Ideonella paludis]|uniref:hypothetical protein n=1 Tax=Ideonella paludis TaxID=1233411 RepID=UPI0036399DE3
MLAAFELAEVQLHHLVDLPSTLRDSVGAWCQKLKVPLVMMVHDYHLICPRITLSDASGLYCGEPDATGCARCLHRDGLDKTVGAIGDWRAASLALMQQAKQVRVPDIDVAQRLARHYPTLKMMLKPHETPPAAPTDTSTPPAVQHVLVIGGLNEPKGYEVLRQAAASPEARSAGLRFTLLGHSINDEALRQAGVTVLGRYEEATLNQRIEDQNPDLIWLPSIWPETYSYVLSAAMESGRRVAAFKIGAPARRLREWPQRPLVHPAAAGTGPQPGGRGGAAAGGAAAGGGGCGRRAFGGWCGGSSGGLALLGRCRSACFGWAAFAVVWVAVWREALRAWAWCVGLVRALAQAVARGSCPGGRLAPTSLGARSRACAVKLPPLPGFARSLWSNSDGEYVLEPRETTRHALPLRASAPQNRPGPRPAPAQVHRHWPAVGGAVGVGVLAAKEPVLGEVGSYKRGLLGARTLNQNGHKGGCRLWWPNALNEIAADRAQVVATECLFNRQPLGVAETGIVVMQQFCRPRSRLGISLTYLFYSTSAQ